MMSVDVVFESPLWYGVPDAEALVQRAVGAVSASAVGKGYKGRICVALADDAAISKLNSHFRGKAGATNVLSFPALAHDRGPGSDRMLGDVMLAFETCAREALTDGKRIADHVTHLVVHGVLHLIGYDHITDADAQSMEAAEITILAALGIADPYAETDPA